MRKHIYIGVLFLLTVLPNFAMQPKKSYDGPATNALKTLLNETHPLHRLPETTIVDLVLAGADPDVEADKGFFRGSNWLCAATYAHKHAKSGHNLFAFLLKNGASPDKKRLLFDACEDGDYAIVDLLLAHGADVTRAENESHNSALLCALGDPKYPCKSRDAIVKLLLENGASLTITRPNKKGISPLSFARAHNMNTILKLFEDMSKKKLV